MSLSDSTTTSTEATKAVEVPAAPTTPAKPTINIVHRFNSSRILRTVEGDTLRSADLRSADLSYANLRSADLSYANLSSANLSYANLRYANLRSADLRSADLSYANLRSANLRSANLSYADLSYANLRYADLRSADLSYADLRSADLSYANLRYANLRSADLSYANLSSADLRSADLRSADLRSAIALAEARGLEQYKSDFWMVLTLCPLEAHGVLAALKEGRVDGSVYSGQCACLLGTIANVRHCHYENIPGLGADADRPAEVWFTMIKPGHTPENSAVVALTVTWFEEWQQVAGNALVAAYETKATENPVEVSE